MMRPRLVPPGQGRCPPPPAVHLNEGIAWLTVDDEGGGPSSLSLPRQLAEQGRGDDN